MLLLDPAVDLDELVVGLRVDPKAYRRLLKVGHGEKLPDDRALGTLHTNEKPWRLLGGWRERPILQGDQVHPSVRYRIHATADSVRPYRPRLPS
ncbi:hypothetical protein ACWCP6_32425 [Streptomyces sp. NPDC002004]